MTQEWRPPEKPGRFSARSDRLNSVPAANKMGSASHAVQLTFDSGSGFGDRPVAPWIKWKHQAGCEEAAIHVECVSGDVACVIRGQEYGCRGDVCDSAWKKDPLGGVIGVQKGTPLRVGFTMAPWRHGELDRDVGRGDGCADSPGLFCPGPVDQGDLPRAARVAEGCPEGSAI